MGFPTRAQQVAEQRDLLSPRLPFWFCGGSIGPRRSDGRGTAILAFLTHTGGSRFRACHKQESRPEGLDAPVGERGNRLSGGQRQRLALARALLRRPALLILDEATNALDEESERAIWNAVSRLRGETTIIVITHRRSALRRTDQVVVLEDGKVDPCPFESAAERAFASRGAA